MNPHRTFLVLLALAVPFSAFAFVKNTAELSSLALTMGIAGSVILTVLVITRKYWRNARRVS